MAASSPHLVIARQMRTMMSKLTKESATFSSPFGGAVNITSVSVTYIMSCGGCRAPAACFAFAFALPAACFAFGWGLFVGN